ncbi:HmuY family protein [Marinospirillum insulare]|uniref:HmuY protein n=1 Tax=Marinospirillum insulare TaxID=217169 RepID=A0ABQ5ZXI5_9GAMM|nr:HmuY family protein [Marinospirillum insulare]GLR62703.1 hypothetical protein GCM10007878_01380 [Marinospirillum insulare]
MQRKTQSSLKFNKKPLAISLALLLLAGGLQGCNSSSDDDKDSSNNGSTPPATSSANLATLDATKAKARIDLATGKVVAEEEPWQVAYQKYIGFSLKTGVKACLAHEITTLYDADSKPIEAEFNKLNKDNTLASFNAVDINNTDICTPVADTVNPQISSDAWWTYNPDPAAAGKVTVHTDTSNGWILKSADGQAYARIKFTEFATRQYTMKMNVEQWSGSNFEPAVSTPDLDFSSSAVYWDLETNSVSATDNGDWELKFSKQGRDILIQVNGGASGKGQAGVAGKDGALQVASVDDVTDPTNTAQVYKYFADSAEGAFTKPGDFGPLEYGVGEGNHDMWPTFATYLIEDNSNFYKMQVISNKGESGSDPSATLVIRYDEAKAK